MEWLQDYLDELGPLAKHNTSWWLQTDTWIVITENQSLTREMVFLPRRPAVVIYGTLLTAWSVLCNLLLLLVLLRKAHTDYSYPLKWLVLNFSWAQLLLGAFVVPLGVTIEHYGKWEHGPVLCRTWLMAQVFLVSLSLWGIVMIALDRFLYVVQPLTYSRKMSRGKMALMVGGTWVISALTLVPLLLPLNDEDYILEEVCAMAMDRHHAFSLAFGAFFAPGLVAVVLCIGLVVVSARADSQRKRLQSSDAASILSTTSSCPTAATPQCACSAATRLCPDVTYATYAEYHDVGNVAASVCAVCLCALAMWGPFYATNLLIPFCDGMCVEPSLWSLFLWLGYTVSGVSPALWFIDRDIRRQCKALIRCEPSHGKVQLHNHSSGSWYFMDTAAGGAGISAHPQTTAKQELRTYRV